jgi:hypothetical protein
LCARQQPDRDQEIPPFVWIRSLWHRRARRRQSK